MTPTVPNESLVLEKIPPSTASWSKIERFALTFDGYECWGSFEACAEIANQQRNNSLTDLRTCLFFEQRRWRHYGEVPSEGAMGYIRELVEKIRSRVESGSLD